jgi:hypothetical protein
MPSALSLCGRHVILSIPPTCCLRQVAGSRPPVDFVRAPPGLCGLQPLGPENIYMAWENTSGLVTWNGETGEVFHHASPQDFGRCVCSQKRSE